MALTQAPGVSEIQRCMVEGGQREGTLPGEPGQEGLVLGGELWGWGRGKTQSPRSGGELQGWRDPCRVQSRLDQLAGLLA